MMRAMSSAVAGLKAQQTGMDVIGNNISNVNTNGFKASRTTYSDVYYQTVQAASAAVSGTKGGSNNAQIGYGATAATVDVDTSRNGYDSSSIATNLYIDGEGYFAVKDGTSYSYTRVGNFSFDSTGQLVNGNGDLVCGSNYSSSGYSPNPDSDGVIASPVPIVIADYNKYKNVKIGSDGIITGELSGTVTTLGRVAVANIPNPAGLSQQGGSMYKVSSNSGTATFYTAGEGPTGKLVPSALETSNVDIANEFANMITTQRGFQANSKIITVCDSMLEEICNMKR